MKLRREVQLFEPVETSWYQSRNYGICVYYEVSFMYLYVDDSIKKGSV